MFLLINANNIRNHINFFVKSFNIIYFPMPRFMSTESNDHIYRILHIVCNRIDFYKSKVPIGSRIRYENYISYFINRMSRC